MALPIEEYTSLPAEAIAEGVSLKVVLVGLRGFESFYPVEISGGMRKRAALARASALDPEVLFFDEPSSGLEPITANRLDDLILQLRDSFGTTIIVVSHDPASIFKSADRALFLDIGQKTMTALGPPADLREHPPSDEVHRFLTLPRDHAMSIRPNPAAIGIFTVGAIVLAVIGIAVLASSTWFTKQSTFIS